MTQETLMTGNQLTTAIYSIERKQANLKKAKLKEELRSDDLLDSTCVGQVQGSNIHLCSVDVYINQSRLLAFLDTEIKLNDAELDSLNKEFKNL